LDIFGELIFFGTDPSIAFIDAVAVGVESELGVGENFTGLGLGDWGGLVEVGVLGDWDDVGGSAF
jgi:hypothetical protein